MRYFLFIFASIFVIKTFAGVYTYTDSQGNVVFTDSPQSNSNAQRLTTEDIGQPVVVPRPTAQTAEATNNTAADSENQQYTSLQIVSPKDQETFQNQPNIKVEVATLPPLQKGDKIQIFLDGVAWGPAQPIIRFSFLRPDRGTHTISAKLLDKNQKVLLETKPITVFIHQAHLGNFPRPQQ